MTDPATGYIKYPDAMADYDELITDCKLFMDTLGRFHFLMGTKFMIPIIGGKELDLHRLFVEVTQRGGIQKVLDEKRWKEVTTVFNFPSTATNASFVLRKYYMSLLQHYEQLYFFKARGWDASAARAAAAAAVASPQKNRPVPAAQIPLHPSAGYQAAAQQQRTINVAAQVPGGASSLAPIVGVIDGKFDSGYLVTVTIGNEKMQGVVYRPAPEVQQQQRYYGSLASHDDNGTAIRRRRKKEIESRDPDMLAAQAQQPGQQDVDIVVEAGLGTGSSEPPHHHHHHHHHLDSESGNSSSDGDVYSYDDDDDGEEDDDDKIVAAAVADL